TSGAGMVPATFTGATTAVWHSAATSTRASCSAGSMDSCHRIFTATHSDTYRHTLDSGSHSAGSWSDLDRLTLLVTATRVRASARSLAYASRCASDQSHAPERHTSPNATVWSISRSSSLVQVCSS